MEDSLSIVTSSARAQSRLHAPTGNSPASLQALSEAGFAIVHEVPGHCGGDLCFGQQRSDAVSANSPLPRAKGSSASRFQGKNPTSSSIADCRRLLGGSPQEGQVRLRVPGACVPQPASDTNRTIHSNSDCQQE